jgi:hypothetical protein
MELRLSEDKRPALEDSGGRGVQAECSGKYIGPVALLEGSERHCGYWTVQEGSRVVSKLDRWKRI